MDIAAMSSQFAQHEDKWVAIYETGNTIVATGDNIFDVDREAERKGYDNILIFKVPRFDVGSIFVTRWLIHNPERASQH